MSATIETTAAGYLITTGTDIAIRYSLHAAVEYCKEHGLQPIHSI